MDPNFSSSPSQDHNRRQPFTNNSATRITISCHLPATPWTHPAALTYLAEARDGQPNQPATATTTNYWGWELRVRILQVRAVKRCGCGLPFDLRWPHNHSSYATRAQPDVVFHPFHAGRCSRGGWVCISDCRERGDTGLDSGALCHPDSRDSCRGRLDGRVHLYDPIPCRAHARGRPPVPPARELDV